MLTPEPNPKELFVYHNAGLGGFGGSSYIDSVILVDQDKTNGLMIGGGSTGDGPADGTLESRRYIMQNWRADVVAVTDPAGVRLESVRYSAYGVPTLIPTADFNGDGVYSLSDFQEAFLNAWFAGLPSADVNFSGGLTSQDVTDFSTIWFAWTAGTQLGRGFQSAYGIRKGYAGYENDGVITRFSHVRNRVSDSENGRLINRQYNLIRHPEKIGDYENNVGYATQGNSTNEECEKCIEEVKGSDEYKNLTARLKSCRSRSPDRYKDRYDVPQIICDTCDGSSNDAGGSFNPRDNTIKMCWRGACNQSFKTILFHELQHAIDRCLHEQRQMDKGFPNPWAIGCDFRACTEIRAYEATCIDSQFSAERIAECVRAAAKASV